MPILRNFIKRERGTTILRALQAQVYIGTTKLNQIENGKQVPDKDEAIRIVSYLCPDETLEHALLKIFNRDDYDYLFRNKIAEIRAAQGKSRGEFASELELNVNILTDLENGVSEPSTQQNRQRILEILDKSEKEVFTPYERHEQTVGQVTTGIVVDISKGGVCCNLEKAVQLKNTFKLTLIILNGREPSNPLANIFVPDAMILREWRDTSNTSVPYGHGIQFSSNIPEYLIDHLPPKLPMPPAEPSNPERRESTRHHTNCWNIEVTVV